MNWKRIKETITDTFRIASQQAMCGSVRYRDAETTVPACHLSHRVLRTDRTTSAKLACRNDQLRMSRR
jgi:hypothetical protein